MLHDIEPGSHVVHFYTDDDALAASVAGYALEGLDHEEGVLLIAEPARLEAVRRLLDLQGMGGGADSRSGVRVLDAADVLDRIVVDGLPAAGAFSDIVGQAMRSTLAGRPRARAYGEMVGKLWRDGNVTGALALEALWNELARELPFSLYCAYEEPFVASGDESAVDAACRLHSSVVGDGALASRSSTCRRFPADDTAPRAARAFVRTALGSRGAQLSDTLALVVSELATNAVRHGGTAFSVTVSSLARGVRIAVSDGRLEAPVLAGFSETDPGGRGLHIVGALCREWGTTRRYGGKTVWAELDW